MITYPVLPDRVIQYGVDQPLPEQIPLRAGPLTLIYEGGDLRYLRLGDREVVRRIYVAVRDQNWGTAPVELHNVTLDAGDDHFHLEYDVVNRRNGIHFTWHGVIDGAADGTIRFTMDGEAQTTFRRNRLGFCVLHPVVCAGQPARITHVEGATTQSVFPVQIAPQLVVNGEIKPVAPFHEMRGVAHQVRPGVWAELAFEGDIFEMEDQRNWTDASYKTYCTPLRLPFPVEVKAGTRVQQAVTLRLRGVESLPADLAMGEAADAAGPRLELAGRSLPIPRLGLGIAGHGRSLTTQEIARLRALHLQHLRADLRLDAPGVETELRRAADEARALGVGLELALHLPDEADAALRDFAKHVAGLRPPVVRWLVFRRRTTEAADLAAVRSLLGPLTPQAQIGGGADLFFTELNRWFHRAAPPPLDALDVVCFSVNPQVHAFDNNSLVETVAAQAAVVQSAQALAPGKAVAVTPVTLRMRFNPNATGPEAPPSTGELPPQVDPRQMSLLGAGWTLGSLRYLAESGAASVTYYETTGWRGVMETMQGPPLPQRFASLPGAVFPLYHLLADVGEFAGGVLTPAATSQPLAVDGFTLAQGARRRTLVANLGPTAQTVTVAGLPAQVQVRLLDAANAVAAMTEPEAFRLRRGNPAQPVDGVLILALPPYAVARLDSTD